MAARREKVSRWGAGRAVPERTAQLAIAHIHARAARQRTHQGYLLATGRAAKSLAEDWLDAMTEALAKAPAGLPPHRRTPWPLQRDTDAATG